MEKTSIVPPELIQEVNQRIFLGKSYFSLFIAPPINLECRLDFNVREKWTTCQWRKSFPDVPVDWVSDYF